MLAVSSNTRMRVFLLALLVCLGCSEVRATPAPSGGCQRPEVLLKAGRALDHINNDQTEGYVLGLNRVYDVTYQRGFIYQLTIDVMETNCHVLSRKSWRQCEPRGISSVPVEGSCDITFREADPVYFCTIRQVSPRAIHQVCPDCITAVPLNDPEAGQSVDMLLEKYNNENQPRSFFHLLRITQVGKGYMFGTGYFVEFTIRESRSVRKGFCKGTRIVLSGTANLVVSCVLFPPQTFPRPRPSGSVDVKPPLDNVPPRPPPSSAQCPSVRTYCVINCR